MSDINSRLKGARAELAELHRQAARLDAMLERQAAGVEKARPLAAHNADAAARVTAYDGIRAQREGLAAETALGMTE